MNKKVYCGWSVAIALALLLTLLSCAALAAEPEAGLSPTTGLETDKPYRPVLAVVSNEKEARPIWNLSEADIVYEAIIWGPGYTRFLALYNDNHPEKVGSLRGARAYQAELREAWDCVFVSWGGQDSRPTSIYDILPKFMHLDGTGRGAGSKHFSRSQERVSPHNAVVNMQKLVADDWPLDEATGKPYEPRLPGLKFSDLAPSSMSRPAVRIDMQYDETETYWVSYTYNPEERVYERWQSGAEQFDGETGKRIVASNVIVQCNTITYFNDAHSRPIIKTVGRGTINAFIDGRMINGTWRRESMGEPIQYFDEFGQPLVLLPGKTFIQIVPQGMVTTYEDTAGVTHMVSGDMF